MNLRGARKTAKSLKVNPDVCHRHSRALIIKEKKKSKKKNKKKQRNNSLGTFQAGVPSQSTE